jgi:hypothetical protein
VHLVRDVEGKTFAHNIKGTLSAAVAASGAEDALEELLSLFRSRKLPKNSEVGPRPAQQQGARAGGRRGPANG